MSNSIITHAVSSTPLGPFRARDCAMRTCAPEAHEGSIAIAPTGEFVLFFTSGPDGPGGSTPMDGGGACDCTSPATLNATCPLACPGRAGCFAGHWNRSSAMATFMSHTPPGQPGGGWSEPVKIPTANCQHPPFNATHYCLDSNLAVVIARDGSLLGMGRASLYTAADWRDPASYTFQPTSGAGGEDPFIYWDARSPPVLHMLRHTDRDTDQRHPNATRGNHGVHYYSTDTGKHWHSDASGALAYGCQVNYVGGGSECVIMRERPHLVFAPDGTTPLALSTAAMHGPPVVPGSFAQNRTSFTLVQALQQQHQPPPQLAQASDTPFRHARLLHVESGRCLRVAPHPSCRSVGVGVVGRDRDVCDTDASCAVHVAPCAGTNATGGAGFVLWSHTDGGRLMANATLPASRAAPPNLGFAYCLSPPGIVCQCYQSSDEEIWSVTPAGAGGQADGHGGRAQGGGAVLISLGPGGLSGSCLVASGPAQGSADSSRAPVTLAPCSSVNVSQHWRVLA